MRKEIITNSPEETKMAAQTFASGLKQGDILALTGNLGSGKTCFAKGVIEELTGSKDNFQGSPTFALIQEYIPCKTGKTTPVFHFDFYRVKHADELYQIGFNEYIFSETGVCVIEWADLFPEVMPPNTQWIKFLSTEENQRKIRYESVKV